MSISDAILEELRAKFRDALNYGAADVLSPIDPLTYRNPEGDTCLHLAAINGDGRTVGLLLDAGLDIDARGDMSQTALHYARAFKHDHIVELLLKRGATRGLIDEFGKES